jgi:hypothetical protein
MTRMLTAALLVASVFASPSAIAAPPPVSPPPAAQPVPRANPDAVNAAVNKQYVRLDRALAPAARAKVNAAARIVVVRFMEKPALGAKPLDPMQVAGAAATQVGLTGVDIEALAFIVLMQATQDMDQDLKQIMAELKAINVAKECLRKLSCARNSTDDLRASLKSSTDLPKTAVDAVVERLHGKLDSLDEVSEATSQRLNILMGQRSKVLRALSNILKKIASTSEVIVQNIK